MIAESWWRASRSGTRGRGVVQLRRTLLGTASAPVHALPATNAVRGYGDPNAAPPIACHCLIEH